MKRANLGSLSVDQLVERFTEISVAQDEASLWEGDVPRFNALYRQLVRVTAELKGRPGDSRRALMLLYGHKNLQVRLNAAKATLALAPDEARQELRAIKASRHQPQAMDAGMALWTLEEGIFQPK